jgi:hypothetical protein
MVFQLVQLQLDDKGSVNTRKPSTPAYEIREHAMAMAEFDAAHCYGDYGYDKERDCWWARDLRGRTFRFVIEPVVVEMAA